MTDITNRLRDLAAVSTWLVAAPPVMMKAAADEIERLRDRVAKDEALLRQALEALCLPCDRWNSAQAKIVNAAVAALGERLGEK